MYFIIKGTFISLENRMVASMFQLLPIESMLATRT